LRLTLTILILAVTGQGCGKIPLDLASILRTGDDNPLVVRGKLSWQLAKGPDGQWTQSPSYPLQWNSSTTISAVHVPDPSLPAAMPELASFGEVDIISLSDDELSQCGRRLIERCQRAALLVTAVILSDQGQPLPGNPDGYYFWLPGWSGAAHAAENLPLILYEAFIPSDADSIMLADVSEPLVFHMGRPEGAVADDATVRITLEYALLR
jgi:hypothetical protein